MYIPFISNKKKPLPSLGKNVGSSSEGAGIESIKIEECSAVAGGPQMSNRPG